MPPFAPIKRSDLVKYLKKWGFDGPYSGGKHPFMIGDARAERAQLLYHTLYFRLLS